MRKILIVILFFFVFFKVEAEGNFFSIAPVFGFGVGGWNSEFSGFDMSVGLRGKYFHEFDSGFAIGTTANFKYGLETVHFQVDQEEYKVEPKFFSLDGHLSFGYLFKYKFVFFDPLIYSRKMYRTAELNAIDDYHTDGVGTGLEIRPKSVNSIGLGGSYGILGNDVFLLGEANLFLFDDRYGHLERYIDVELAFIVGFYLKR